MYLFGFCAGIESPKLTGNCPAPESEQYAIYEVKITLNFIRFFNGRKIY